MNDNSREIKRFREYKVWDRTTRWFHWINFLSVLGLIAVGTVILYNKKLGISTDGKILLKTIHVYIGYIFCINLTWRLVWGFIGNRYARFKAILPGGKGYMCALGEYAKGFISGDAPGWLGHNPIGRLMVAVLLALLLIQGGTGLIIAGTDIYYPPIGNKMKEWIAKDQSKLDLIKPYSKENVDAAKYKEMKKFRSPYIWTHKNLYYALLILIAIHIAAAVVSDMRERNGIISAMFSGRKFFKEKPVDAEEE
ncbi:MAG: cytochrome b/b6 domain-containing protein [Deltaproteobacteria bacterium]|nr:cytochrome b/b6 domain-containing protein [Deltaproteobacteria bacterium]